VSGNYFDQTGAYPTDETRVFTFNDLATPDYPATFCSPPDLPAESLALNSQLAEFTQPSNVLNGLNLNLTDNVIQTFEYYISVKTDSVAGGLIENCAAFEGQAMPVLFETSADVFEYVNSNAGQVGKNTP
jgi:hypothetical protein